MFVRTTFISCMLVIAALGMLLLSCSGKDGATGPAGPRVAQIMGQIYSPRPGFESGNIGDVYVTVSESPSIASVYVNGLKLKMNSLNSFADTEFPINIGDSVHLVVDYQQNPGMNVSAWADIILPGAFSIVSHDTSQYAPVYPDSIFQISWSGSANASGYLAHIFLNYVYGDSNHNRHYYSLYMDTTLIDTFIAFQPTLIFPTGFDSLINVGDSYFSVSSVCGPFKEGDFSNIKGDGVGFFNALTYGGALELSLRYGTILSSSHRFIAHEDNLIIQRYMASLAAKTKIIKE